MPAASRLAPARRTCSERVWHSLCRGRRKRDDSVAGWNARRSRRLCRHNQDDRKFLSNMRVTSLDSDIGRLQPREVQGVRTSRRGLCPRAGEMTVHEIDHARISQVTLDDQHLTARLRGLLMRHHRNRFSASSRALDLKSEATRFTKRVISAAIAAKAKRQSGGVEPVIGLLGAVGRRAQTHQRGATASAVRASGSHGRHRRNCARDRLPREPLRRSG